jgi:hypothetical protein
VKLLLGSCMLRSRLSVPESLSLVTYGAEAFATALAHEARGRGLVLPAPVDLAALVP